jgi:phosphonoacetate hydrolase
MLRNLPVTRRGFFLAAGAVSAGVSAAVRSPSASPAGSQPPQRVCVVLLDRFGTDYLEQSPMPTLKSWARDGFFKRIRGVMPSVTNTNVTGLCCGLHADEHGITGNSYWDEDGDREQFMSDGDLRTATTLFQRAARSGVRSALLSAKQKTIPLLRQGTALAVGAQQPPPELVRRFGPPPDIYSPDVNYWVCEVALDVVKNRPTFGLIFVHTTDYPMHRYPPEAGESRAHLRRIDDFLRAASQADPGLAFFVTADHGMNAKATVLNLGQALARRGVALKVAMSAERDQYPRHHSGYGGTAFIYLKSPADVGKTIQALRELEGVEEALPRDEAARKYRLNPHRIGDVWVTAGKDVVFGPSAQERDALPKGYRSHGSAYELDIPCVIYRYAGKLPDPADVRTNVDVCKFLYPRGRA